MPGTRRIQAQQTLEVRPKYTPRQHHKMRATSPGGTPPSATDLARFPPRDEPVEPDQESRRGGDHPSRADGDWRSCFLAALRECANVRLACDAANISRKMAYKAREQDQVFAAAWQNAMEDALDGLEERARERALDGSDTLMMFLLKAHRPAVYRDHARVEHSGPRNAAIPVDAVSIRVIDMILSENTAPLPEPEQVEAR